MKKQRKLILRIMIVTMLTAMLLNACGTSNGETTNGNTQEAQVPDNTQAVTFTDDLGRTVTVKNPKRVAALLGSYAHIWHLAGGTIAASADDAWTDFELPLSEDAVNLGGTKKLSLEKLFEADPDFIIASSNTTQHMEWKDTLEGAKFNVAYFEVNDFEDYLRVLKICTQITGREDLYEKYGSSIRQEIEETIARSAERIAKNGKAPKILSLRASATWIRAKKSSGNVLGEMLKDLGCINIADKEDSLLENLSLEHIMEQDPEYIFICQQGDDAEAVKANMERFIAENPAWSNLTAVKEGRVYYMEKALYTLKPNNRWSEAYEKLEEMFAD